MASTPGQEMTWTIGRLLTWTTAYFQEHGVEGGRLAAELLLARAMQCRKIDLYARYEREPTSDERAVFRDLVRQATEQTPIAYLLGMREFYSLEFTVSPAVLIPRPETETLVQRAIELCRGEPERNWNVLDVGTGSGCVAVAIARFAPNVRMVATDISADALLVAAENVARHGLDDRVRLIEADGPAVAAEYLPAAGFDLLVSNPPYISDEVWAGLPAHIRNHEPRIALTGAGGDGLGMYRRFAVEAPAILAPGGRLLAEIGHDQREAVLEIYDAAGAWRFIEMHRDPTDPHERVAEFQLR